MPGPVTCYRLCPRPVQLVLNAGILQAGARHAAGLAGQVLLGEALRRFRHLAGLGRVGDALDIADVGALHFDPLAHLEQARRERTPSCTMNEFMIGVVDRIAQVAGDDGGAARVVARVDDEPERFLHPLRGLFDAEVVEHEHVGLEHRAAALPSRFRRRRGCRFRAPAAAARWSGRNSRARPCRESRPSASRSPGGSCRRRAGRKTPGPSARPGTTRRTSWRAAARHAANRYPACRSRARPSRTWAGCANRPGILLDHDAAPAVAARQALNAVDRHAFPA